MKKNYYILVVLIVLLLIFGIIYLAYARRGCCSHHGGVCGCSCCDGTSLSSTCAPYYPECSKFYVPSPSKIIPIGPENSMPPTEKYEDDYEKYTPQGSAAEDPEDYYKYHKEDATKYRAEDYYSSNNGTSGGSVVVILLLAGGGAFGYWLFRKFINKPNK